MEKKGDLRTVNAVRVLGNLRQKAAKTAPQIAQAFDKAEPDQRHFVVDALLAVDESGEQAIPILNKSLAAQDPLDRREALLGLMKFRNNIPAVLPSIMKAFDDPVEENRLLALSIVRGLGEKAKDALPALIPLTQSPDPKIRRTAVGAIGSMRSDSPEAISALQKTLGDQDTGVRLAAVYALVRVSAVAPEETKNRVKEILHDSLGRETNQNVKQALQSALLPRERASAKDQHSKLEGTEGHTKSEAGSKKNLQQ
jgi:HEAT repeat protein